MTTPATPPARRVVALMVQAAATALALLACALGLAWIVGRVATDRWHWSQYLFWMPGLLVAWAGTALSGVAMLGGLGSRLVLRERSPRALRIASRSGLALSLVALASVALDYRRPSPAPARTPSTLKVVCWNIASLVPQDRWDEWILREDPDVAVLRPGHGLDFSRLFDAYATGGTAQDFYGGRTDFPRFGMDWIWGTSGFCVTSRVPIKAWADLSLKVEPGLGLDPRRRRFIRSYKDPGRAMLLVLDTTARVGRDTVVWLVDLPSDLSLWREDVMRESRAAIDAFAGPAWFPDAAERKWVRREAPPGLFASPDIVMGDFNTPRGSRSLRLLAGEGAHAFDEAGRGWGYSFPRAWRVEGWSVRRWRVPLWHVDHCFVSSAWRVLDYRVVDTGLGTHRAQVAMVEFRGAPAGADGARVP